jgi:hypothetical protein
METYIADLIDMEADKQEELRTLLLNTEIDLEDFDNDYVEFDDYAQ